MSKHKKYVSLSAASIQAYHTFNISDLAQKREKTWYILNIYPLSDVDNMRKKSSLLDRVIGS